MVFGMLRSASGIAVFGLLAFLPSHASASGGARTGGVSATAPISAQVQPPVAANHSSAASRSATTSRRRRRWRVVQRGPGQGPRRFGAAHRGADRRAPRAQGVGAGDVLCVARQRDDDRCRRRPGRDRQAGASEVAEARQAQAGALPRDPACDGTAQPAARARRARVGAHDADRDEPKPRPKPTPAPTTTTTTAPPPPPPTPGGTFPVAGPYSFGDGFGAPRKGYTHQGQDILAALGTPVVAPLAGSIDTTGYQATSAGYYVVRTPPTATRSSPTAPASASP